MTHSAINEGFAVCQARLGAKIHDAKDPASDLGPMFRQVVGTLFTLAGATRTDGSASAARTPSPSTASSG